MHTNLDPANPTTTGLVIPGGTTIQAALEAFADELVRLSATHTNPLKIITGGAPTPAGLQYLASNLSGDLTSNSTTIRSISLYREGKDADNEWRVYRLIAWQYGANLAIADFSFGAAGEYGVAGNADSRDWCLLVGNPIGINHASQELGWQGINHSVGNTTYDYLAYASLFIYPNASGDNPNNSEQSTIDSGLRVHMWVDEDFMSWRVTSEVTGLLYNNIPALFEIEPSGNDGWAKGDLPRVFSTHIHTDFHAADVDGEAFNGYFFGIFAPGDVDGTPAYYPAMGDVKYNNKPAYGWSTAQDTNLNSSLLTPSGQYPVHSIMFRMWTGAVVDQQRAFIGFIPSLRVMNINATAAAPLTEIVIETVDHHILHRFANRVFCVPEGIYSATP